VQRLPPALGSQGGLAADQRAQVSSDCTELAVDAVEPLVVGGQPAVDSLEAGFDHGLEFVHPVGEPFLQPGHCEADEALLVVKDLLEVRVHSFDSFFNRFVLGSPGQLQSAGTTTIPVGG
jgi:hypothetical protein